MAAQKVFQVTWKVLVCLFLCRPDLLLYGPAPLLYSPVKCVTIEGTVVRNETDTVLIKNKVMRQIEKLLIKNYAPTHLEIQNLSYLETGVPQSEDPELAVHLRLVVISPIFQNISFVHSTMVIHQMLMKEGIYENEKVRDITILAKTPKDWEEDKYLEEREKNR